MVNMPGYQGWYLLSSDLLGIQVSGVPSDIGFLGMDLLETLLSDEL